MIAGSSPAYLIAGVCRDAAVVGRKDGHWDLVVAALVGLQRIGYTAGLGLKQVSHWYRCTASVAAEAAVGRID